MNKYTTDGEEVSAIKKAEHKLKQLREASDLLEEFSDRCAWADDFACYQSIREAIDNVYTAVEQSKDEIDEEIVQMEEELEEFEQNSKYALTEMAEDFAQSIDWRLE